MKEYTQPGYVGRMSLDGRVNYARSLLRKLCPNYGKPGETHCACCGFPELMGSTSTCCGWLVDGDPEKAIVVLENLLGIAYKPEYDSPWTVKAIADHNGLGTVLDLTQEECAELVQAISKHRRNTYGGDTLEHIIEEIADVSIMLDELCTLIPSGADRVKRWRDAKVLRTLQRYHIEPDTEVEEAVWEQAMDEVGTISMEEWEGPVPVRVTLVDEDFMPSWCHVPDEEVDDGT